MDRFMLPPLYPRGKSTVIGKTEMASEEAEQRYVYMRY
jgi:hypothetical protein